MRPRSGSIRWSMRRSPDKLADVEKEFAKASVAGTKPVAIVGAALRQIERLHALRLDVESGTSASAVVEGQHAIHFRRKPLVEAALKSWTSDRLVKAMTMLARGLARGAAAIGFVGGDRAARADRRLHEARRSEVRA